MPSLHVFLFLASLICPIFSPVTAKHGTVHAGSESKYTKAHSLGDEYNFDTRDGWQSVTASDLDYKYRPSNNTQHSGSLVKRTAKATKLVDISIGDTVKGVLNNVWNGLKGIGRPEAVTITWYTGHDLENPSCWPNNGWAPTDDSFACALTLDGWTTRPKCFKFLELCNTPQKCVFVRVVDTCAGCAKGSKHVDLTRAAFGVLAPFDQGVLTVQLRIATEPAAWYESLWGPKVN